MHEMARDSRFRSSQNTFVPLKRTDYSNEFSFNNKFFDKLEKVDRVHTSNNEKMSYMSVIEKNKQLLKMSTGQNFN